MTNPTDTNQASELFELCKEVYELTGWDSTEKCYAFIDEFGDGGKHWRVIPLHEDNVDDVDDWHPLYTSDYLADKLRDYDWTITNLNSKQFSLQSDSLSEPDAAILGETLTLVLLRLTLALYEEGAFNE